MSLSNPRSVNRFAVGDAVTYTNPQGVRFEGKAVIGIDESTCARESGEPCYFIAPTDTPWISFEESALSFANAATIAKTIES